jgi:ABC-2 type transport system ATP-binding protein
LVNAIEVTGLTKKYGAFTAVNNLSFSVKMGETLGLLGTNGAGKSTTIQILTGQLLATSGSVSVLGLNPAQDPKAVHDIIGYIPDQQSLYDELTVYENIDFFRKLRSLPKEDTLAIIDAVFLKDKKNVRAKNLSKGLRQRVLIARSIIHRPKILFLDEPTSGLDPSSANTICSLLEGLKQNGTTILLTTHLMNEVDRLCDKIIFIDQGQKIEEGTSLNLKLRYRKPTVNVVRKENDIFLKEELSIDDNNIFDRLKSLQQEGLLIDFSMQSPSLEEIFIKITKGDTD